VGWLRMSFGSTSCPPCALPFPSRFGERRPRSPHGLARLPVVICLSVLSVYRMWFSG
jgi:hypothetical protein